MYYGDKIREEKRKSNARTLRTTNYINYNLIFVMNKAKLIVIGITAAIGLSGVGYIGYQTGVLD